MTSTSIFKLWQLVGAYLLIGVSLHVQADGVTDWKDFYLHKDSTAYAAYRGDLPEFRKVNGSVKVWVRMTCTTAKQCPVSMGKVQWIADCGKRQLAVGRSFFYDHDGKLLDGGNGRPGVFQDMAPDTIANVFYELVCEK